MKELETDSFFPEIVNPQLIGNGVLIFTLRRRVVEQYKNTMLSIMEKSWCITIGKNGLVRFVNEKGKMEKKTSLYFY